MAEGRQGILLESYARKPGTGDLTLPPESISRSEMGGKQTHLLRKRKEEQEQLKKLQRDQLEVARIMQLQWEEQDRRRRKSRRKASSGSPERSDALSHDDRGTRRSDRARRRSRSNDHRRRRSASRQQDEGAPPADDPMRLFDEQQPQPEGVRAPEARRGVVAGAPLAEQDGRHGDNHRVVGERRGAEVERRASSGGWVSTSREEEAAEAAAKKEREEREERARPTGRGPPAVHRVVAPKRRAATSARPSVMGFCGMDGEDSEDDDTASNWKEIDRAAEKKEAARLRTMPCSVMDDDLPVSYIDRRNYS